MSAHCYGCRRDITPASDNFRIKCHACQSFFCVYCTRVQTVRTRLALKIAGFPVPSPRARVYPRTFRVCWPCKLAGYIGKNLRMRPGGL